MRHTTVAYKTFESFIFHEINKNITNVRIMKCYDYDSKYYSYKIKI